MKGRLRDLSVPVEKVTAVRTIPPSIRSDPAANSGKIKGLRRMSQNELSGRTGVDEHKLAGFFLIYRDLQALTTDVSEA